MGVVAEAHKRLDWCGDQHVCAIIWSEEDVLARAKELGYVCSQEQAGDIIDEIDRRQDATIGVTWDTIDVYLPDYCQKEG